MQGFNVTTALIRMPGWRSGAATASTVLTILVSGCLPFVADHQSAALLPAGKTEVTPSISYVSLSGEGETEHIQTHFGLRAAYGISRLIEVRGAFEHVDIEDADKGTNVIGLGPKVSLVPNRLAIYAPVGFITGGGVESGETWTAVPTLLFNAVTGNTFELTPSLKAFVPISGDDRDVFVGLHLGAGISSDLSRWALRPEVGVVRNPGEKGTTWGLSMGFSVRP